MQEKTKIAFLLSHPIQYFSPLLQALAQEKEFTLKVYYCSDHGVSQKIDKEFGRIVTWDIPLLEGYEYEFIYNASANPSVTSFWGLINFGIFKKLHQDKPDILIVHGWGYFTHWLAITVAKLLGIRVWLRGETPLKQEIAQKKDKNSWRNFIFNYFLFRGINKFLYIGSENKKFYSHFGIADNKLIFTPYCIDNQRFNGAYVAIKNKKKDFKAVLGIAENSVVFLFCGKLIEKKQPLLLLEAYKNMKSANKALLLIGDGNLQSVVNQYIAMNNLKNVYVLGFKNQRELAQYYTMADIFVLPSTIGETWGLVVNEAMNFELPLLVSDMVGCAEDLVLEGENGYVFENENAADLQMKMDMMIENRDFMKSAGKKSHAIIQTYSIETIVNNLKEAIKNLYTVNG
jgi:glycosyltransferase involved in cell wall biosynthesis